MNPEVQLVLGCFGLGLVIAYMLWVAIRDDLFRYKLGGIRDQLDAAMAAKNATDDPAYLGVRYLIDYLIKDAANWYPSPLVLERATAKIYESARDFEGRLEDLPNRPIDVSSEVRESLFQILLCLGAHVFLGHLRGWWLLVRIVFSSGLEGSQKRILQSLVDLSSVLRRSPPTYPHGVHRSIPST